MFLYLLVALSVSLVSTSNVLVNEPQTSFANYVSLRNSSMTCANFVDSISMYCFVLSVPDKYTKYLVSDDDFNTCSQLLTLCQTEIDYIPYEINTTTNTTTFCVNTNYSDTTDIMLQSNTTFPDIPFEYAPAIYDMCQLLTNSYYVYIENNTLSNRFVSDTESFLCADTKVYRKCIIDLTPKFIELLSPTTTPTTTATTTVTTATTTVTTNKTTTSSSVNVTSTPTTTGTTTPTTGTTNETTTSSSVNVTSTPTTTGTTTPTTGTTNETTTSSNVTVTTTPTTTGTTNETTTSSNVTVTTTATTTATTTGTTNETTTSSNVTVTTTPTTTDTTTSSTYGTSAPTAKPSKNKDKLYASMVLLFVVLVCAVFATSMFLKYRNTKANKKAKLSSTVVSFENPLYDQEV